MQLDDAGEYGWTLAAAAGRGHMHKRVPEARSLASSGAAAVSTRGAAAAWAGVARVRGDHQVNVLQHLRQGLATPVASKRDPHSTHF